MQRLMAILIISSFTLIGCSGKESNHSKEENMKRNDTSNYPTNIGKNKSY